MSKFYPIFSEQQKIQARKIARNQGFKTYTKIVIGDKDEILHCLSSGMRKLTNGEYVNKTYQKKCFGKGIYYQHAVCEVSVRTFPYPY